MQHLLVDGRWCRLSEVDDPRLILSDVMHQHNSTTKHQQSTKLALYSTKSKLTLLVVLFRGDSYVSITHPPIPEVWGWTIPKQRAAVIAASTLDPCFPRTSKPRDVHWATSVTTAPWLNTLQETGEQRRKGEIIYMPLNGFGLVWEGAETSM